MHTIVMGWAEGELLSPVDTDFNKKGVDGLVSYVMQLQGVDAPVHTFGDTARTPALFDRIYQVKPDIELAGALSYGCIPATAMIATKLGMNVQIPKNKIFPKINLSELDKHLGENKNIEVLLNRRFNIIPYLEKSSLTYSLRESDTHFYITPIQKI